MSNLIGHGFIAPEITPDQHIFGAEKLPMTVVQDNGNWMPFLPPEELQARKEFDTYGCTVYNTLKPIAILHERLYQKEKNYSERFTYVLSGTKPPGNNPHIIAETIRKAGLIDDELLPFDSSITSLEGYASPNPMGGMYIAEGERWHRAYDFMHEWSFQGGDPKFKHDCLKETLRRSPLGVSVVAWKEKNGIYYKEEGEQDNHWTCLIGYDDEYPVVFDTYEPFIKCLSPNYDFSFAKRYYLARKIEAIPVPKKSFFSFLNAWFPLQNKMCSA